MRTSSSILARTCVPVACGSVLLALAAACSGGDDGSAVADGPTLFRQQCSQCHAADGTGSALAPTLRGKAGHWTRDALLDYLFDPVGYAKKDPRLAAQGTKYSLPMPSYKMLPRASLEAITDHVLALP